MLLSHWGKAKAVNQKTDSAWSVVTQLDIDVETFVMAELTRIHTDIEFVGEERGGDRTAKKFWLMDPIDGTAHYIRGLPFCTSMLALVDAGEVVFSAIYDFLHDEMYSAEKGKGAFKNDKAIRVSERPLSSAFVSFETRVEVPENAALRNTMRERTDLVTTFSAGWEFAMVASGKIDARVCKDPYGMDYDFAPGTLLVTEAGGIVRNIGSNDFDYKNLNFIAANPTVYKDLTEGEEALFPLK
ncbi:inositol monophosphatase [Candidatus Kaiserbacteria bacterium]|nr:inositol monophosphatase [Candidatus Kaiserbacteria bacterium]